MSKLAYFDDIDDKKEGHGERAAPEKGLTEEDYEKVKEDESAWQEERERSGLTKKAVEALLIAACVYVVFLIYGVFNTNYAYNSLFERRNLLRLVSYTLIRLSNELYSIWNISDN